MKSTLLAMWLVLLGCATCRAVNWYVRDGATGSGTSWSDAYDQITSAYTSASRGDTILVADGSYTTPTLSKAVSGTTLITVQKATVASHGTETGWDNTYGDGQAALSGDMSFATSYHLVDGMTRDETDWQDETAYGFKMSAGSEVGISAQQNNITIRYLDVEGTSVGSHAAIRMVDFETPWKNNITFSRCQFQKSGIPIFSNNSEDITVEYCWFGPSYSKETIRQQFGGNWIIRYCYFIDCGSGTGDDQLTAIIGMFNFDGMGAQTPTATQVENGQIYGCVFGKSGTGSSQAVSDGITSIISTGWVFYNNTVYDTFDSGPNDIRVHKNGEAGTANIVRNVLFYEVLNPIATTETEGDFWVNTSHSLTGTIITGSEDPFENLATLDFRIKDSAFSGNSPINQAFNSGAPYDVDLFGTTHDNIGAFATFGGGDPPASSAPVARGFRGLRLMAR